MLVSGGNPKGIVVSVRAACGRRNKAYIELLLVVGKDESLGRLFYRTRVVPRGDLSLD